MGDFVSGLSDDWPHADCPNVFSEGLGDNPRQIKRTVNTFLMLWKLAEKRKDKLQDRVKPIRLAKVVAIQTVYPDLYNLLLKDEPRYLGELEKYYRAENFGKESESVYEKRGIRTLGGSASPSEKEQSEVQEKFEPAPALVPFLSRKGSAAVKRILTLHKADAKEMNFAELKPDELKLYFTLTARAEAPVAAPSIEEARLVFEPQIIKIPAGSFLMGSSKAQAEQAIKDGLDKKYVEWEQPQQAVELSEYYIGKYPITNREYQAFVRDARYKPPQHWEGDVFPPEKGSHPVVNVSWEDATNYCKWLSDKTKKNYRLPTEAEWEKASRGEDGRVYPWGNTFDVKNANTAEAKINDTSDVGKFSPQGDSPYGCADMAGNVWEWCHDWFNENEYQRSSPVDKQRQAETVKDPFGPQKGQNRVLRGGSFLNIHWYTRCALRSGGNPSYILRNYGFRIVFSPITPL